MPRIYDCTTGQWRGCGEKAQKKVPQTTPQLPSSPTQKCATSTSPFAQRSCPDCGTQCGSRGATLAPARNCAKWTEAPYKRGDFVRPTEAALILYPKIAKAKNKVSGQPLWPAKVTDIYTKGVMSGNLHTTVCVAGGGIWSTDTLEKAAAPGNAISQSSSTPKASSLVEYLRALGIDVTETEHSVCIDARKSDGSFVCPVCSQPGRGNRSLECNPHGRISAIELYGTYVGTFRVHPECLLLLPALLQDRHVDLGTLNMADQLTEARKAFKDPAERKRAWEMIQGELIGHRCIVEDELNMQTLAREERRRRVMLGLERGPDPRVIL